MAVISSGDGIGGSIRYVRDEKLEITGGETTPPKAGLDHLVYIRRVTEAKDIIIGGAFGQGASIKGDKTDTSPKVKAGDAIGRLITYSMGKFETTGGRTDGMDANATNLRELAKTANVKEVLISEAKAQGVLIYIGEEIGEGDGNERGAHVMKDDLIAVKGGGEGNGSGTHELEDNEGDALNEQESNDSDTLYEKEGN